MVSDDDGDDDDGDVVGSNDANVMMTMQAMSDQTLSEEGAVLLGDEGIQKTITGAGQPQRLGLIC